MAQIVQVGTDRRLQLGSEEFTRVMRWGAAWSKIRIGVRFGINGDQSITGYAGGMGLCAGTSGYYASFTTSFIGFYSYGDLTWTPAAGPYFTWALSNANSVKKSGTTATVTGYGLGITPCVASAPKNTAQMFLDITKTGLVFNLVVRAPAASEVVRTVTAYDFLRNMENEAGTLLYSTSTGSGTNLTLTSDPGHDTVSLFHNKVTPTIEYSSIEAFRFE